MNHAEQYILWFEDITINDVELVGGKNASLGEMYREVSSHGINIPYGFAITATAYKHLIEYSGADKQITSILSDLDTHDLRNLQERGEKVRQVIRDAEFPEKLKQDIVDAYTTMEEKYGKNVDVAVRSSATAEDLPDASFAGQQDTYLNIQGSEAVLHYCSECFASLFTDRAISYRHDKGYSQFEVYLSIVIQKMVRSDSACSGVLFTLDTESGFDQCVYITGAWGLGENVVGGAVTPDEFYVFKPTLKQGKRPIVSKKIGKKEIKMVYADSDHSHENTVNVATTFMERNQYILSDDELLELARWAVKIEEHYGRHMDIEWAKDGDATTIGSGKLYIVQARPETVHSQKSKNITETYILKEQGNLLVSGQAVGSKIGQGQARIIRDISGIHDFQEGEILVTDMTDPDWEPIMKKAGAIVTNRGGRTCHAAIISRELGIPCLIGSENGTEEIMPGTAVTVSCAEGETGHVYEGLLDFAIDTVELTETVETRTKIMLNVGIPEKAFFECQVPNDGVGLAREEFIINAHIGIHPLALYNFSSLLEQAGKGDQKIAEIVQQIEDKTSAYPIDKQQFFIDKLAEGVARIGAGFYPRDVIVRLSDFKSNEYANLIGGQLYEPVESNPMIGWRGASRYYDPKYIDAFELECKGLQKVRKEMGLTNIKLMVPFCRTPEEGRKVIETMKKFGLVQGEDGLEVYVMCEIPSNVIAADQFADIFDGFSIGSNDLTQLTLGLDRDSDLVAHIFDERNDAVKSLVKMVIDTAKRRGRKIGICGQAPSDYPEFALFLVDCGIDSISLIPDTALKTKLRVQKREQELGISVG